MLLTAVVMLIAEWFFLPFDRCSLLEAVALVVAVLTINYAFLFQIQTLKEDYQEILKNRERIKCCKSKEVCDG